MKPVGNYNKLSDEVLAMIPPMKGTVVFQMLNGVPNPEPDPQERAKMPMLYGKTQLQTQFKIRDPKANRIVDIVLSEDWDDKQQPIRPKLFVPGMGETHFQGVFALAEGSVEDEELYEIFWLSPEREGSPFAERGTQPRFKIVNKEFDSKQTIKNVDELRKALEAASKISEEDARVIMLSQNENLEGVDALAAVKDMARVDPKKFMALNGDANTKTKSDIKLALDKGLIVFDAATGKVNMGNKVLTTLDTNVDNLNVLDGITSWINEAANGKDVLEGLRKQLKKQPADA